MRLVLFGVEGWRIVWDVEVGADAELKVILERGRVVVDVLERTGCLGCEQRS